MTSQLTINHASVAEGGPTHILAPDGATTIARVVEMFKEQTGAAGTIRLRTSRRHVLRLTDTLDEAGLAGMFNSRVLLAFRNTRQAPATRALRRIERGITLQSYAHG